MDKQQIIFVAYFLFSNRHSLILWFFYIMRLFAILCFFRIRSEWIYVLIPNIKRSSLSLFSHFNSEKVQSTKSVVIMVDCGFLADCRLLEQQYRKLTIIEFYFVFPLSFLLWLAIFLIILSHWIVCIVCEWLFLCLSLGAKKINSGWLWVAG